MSRLKNKRLRIYPASSSSRLICPMAARRCTPAIFCRPFTKVRGCSPAPTRLRICVLPAPAASCSRWSLTWSARSTVNIRCPAPTTPPWRPASSHSKPPSKCNKPLRKRSTSTANIISNIPNIKTVSKPAPVNVFGEQHIARVAYLKLDIIYVITV